MTEIHIWGYAGRCWGFSERPKPGAVLVCKVYYLARVPVGWYFVRRAVGYIAANKRVKVLAWLATPGIFRAAERPIRAV